MARINLLPWREELRTERKKRFLTNTAVAAVLTLALVGLVHLYFQQLVSYQKSRNTFLQSQIVVLDKKIKEIKDLEKERKGLMARMRAIEELQTSRPIIVHLFDELVGTLPEGVYLKEVSQKGDAITLKGVARSNARVSNFMRNLDDSPWLMNPVLNVIESKTSDGRRISNFTLRVKQTPQQKDEEE